MIHYNITSIKHIEELFKLMLEQNASDLHLQVGSPPLFRVANILTSVGSEPITKDHMEHFLKQVMNEEKLKTFLQEEDIDLAYDLPQFGRIRINCFFQKNNISMAARLVKNTIPSFEELNLPPVLNQIAENRSGLILVTGIAGSGKSTTLSAMINYINNSRKCHILTVEDPIEYIYTNKKALISQREIGIDVHDFSHALKYALRQNPDIILIGEMRDPETVSFGLTAAETGHLVLGTLHSYNASQTIGRILDFFSPEKQSQIRQTLRFTLCAIISQKLIPSLDEQSAIVPAVEILINNPSIKELIRKSEDNKIPDAIKVGKNEGMQTFNQSLLDLVEKKLISKEIALRASPNPDALAMNLKGIFLDDEKGILL
ncbi:type IV pilus twitching motility protein PilT [Chlamydiota bacterium]